LARTEAADFFDGPARRRDHLIQPRLHRQVHRISIFPTLAWKRSPHFYRWVLTIRYRYLRTRYSRWNNFPSMHKDTPAPS